MSEYIENENEIKDEAVVAEEAAVVSELMNPMDEAKALHAKYAVEAEDVVEETAEEASGGGR